MHQDGVNSLALALTACFVSGCAALRGDVAPLLPGIFFRPSMPCRALHECNCLYLMAFFLRNGGKNT
ncbi:hypothetical protein EJC75_25710 (plasmid) [Escherichia coli]|nr:hypothetical protein EJC75_25710 [Escherichia coli]